MGYTALPHPGQNFASAFSPCPHCEQKRLELFEAWVCACITDEQLAEFFDWSSMDTVKEYTALGGRKTIRRMGDEKAV
jgi:hypothetical protein